MHELSIAIAILEAAAGEAERYAISHPGQHPVAVHVRVGALSGIEPGSLKAAFELARADGLSDCELVVLELPVACRCACSPDVQQVRSIQEMVCAGCGRPATNIVQGR